MHFTSDKLVICMQLKNSCDRNYTFVIINLKKNAIFNALNGFKYILHLPCAISEQGLI